MVKATKLYTLEVFLIDGPMTKKFIDKNPVVSRTLEIQGDQTLEDLHDAIFDAFDREDEHLYEFQIGGKGPNDPDAKRYGLAEVFEEMAEEDKVDGDAGQTSIDALNLEEGSRFGYWFDFGDDWWHQINVISIREKAGPGNYPKVVKKVGKSPPQYTDEYE
jgi:hypothetical protein